MGDRGPRVVVLQVLLNRSGRARLVVDGIFGSHTRQAVSDARRRLLQSTGDVADPDLWVPLLQEQHLCGVDAFDVGEERAVTGATIVRSAGSRVVMTGAMCNGIPAVVQGIVSATSPPASLAVLRTWGHGNRGHWLSFTVGEVVETTERDPVLGAAIARESSSYLSADNFDANVPALTPVGRCFAPMGFYEHHGCSLGKIPATRRMMGRLATLWNVPVTVAMGLQYIPIDGPTALRFQGHTFTAYPQGSEEKWLARVRAAEATPH